MYEDILSTPKLERALKGARLHSRPCLQYLPFGHTHEHSMIPLAERGFSSLVLVHVPLHTPVEGDRQITVTDKKLSSRVSSLEAENNGSDI